MPSINISDTFNMYYEIDSFAEPWLTPEAILLVHGVAESSAVWYAWIPHLARKYAVIRADLRGFGKSSIPPEGYQWSLANFARDLEILLNKFGLQKVHLVGAKLGGTISWQFAYDYPEKLHSLTVVGAPVRFGEGKANAVDFARIVKEKGLNYWARATMQDRLGDVPNEMMEWWIKLFNSNSRRVVSEVLTYAGRTADVSSLLPRIKIPTLAIVGEGDLIASMNAAKRWQKSMPNCELVSIPVKAYHVAASRPDECVSALLRFLHSL